MREFELPDVVADLWAARNRLRDHYLRVLKDSGSDVDLAFTLDGNLVGDIGEALAVELFGIRLVNAKSTEGIDGHAADGRAVQVKATGKGYGPAFRFVETRADHLVFFDLDLENGKGVVIFNGPERYATAKLPKTFSGQRSLTPRQIREADKLVSNDERLAMLI